MEIKFNENDCLIYKNKNYSSHDLDLIFKKAQMFDDSMNIDEELSETDAYGNLYDT